MSTKPKKLLVVIDTNVWKSNLYLKSPIAAAVKTYLTINNAKICLPEVIELEIRRHLEIDINSCIGNIEKDFSRLLAWFGELRELVLPENHEVSTLVQKYLDFSGLDIVRIPFDGESAKKSFLRTIEKRRPSHRSQQFKDGVIWEACKLEALQHRVILVTSDKAFYEDDNVKNGLSTELKMELGDHDLSICPDLVELLDGIRKKISVDEAVLDSCIRNQLGSDMNSLAERNDFSISSGKFGVKFFVTEEANVLFVDIRAEYECDPVNSEEQRKGILHLHCDGTYSVVDGRYVGLSALDMRLTYNNEEGELTERAHHFLRLEGAVVGHKTVHHTVRHPLD